MRDINQSNPADAQGIVTRRLRRRTTSAIAVRAEAAARASGPGICRYSSGASNRPSIGRRTPDRRIPGAGIGMA
jgi:hypothetical protein